MWAWVIGGLAITALQLPSLIQAQTVDTPVTKCDRVGSREANAVIATVLQPRIDKLGYTVPESCPLDVNKNMFKLQEAHKVLMRKSIWKCKWDDKVRLSSLIKQSCVIGLASVDPLAPSWFSFLSATTGRLSSGCTAQWDLYGAFHLFTIQIYIFRVCGLAWIVSGAPCRALHPTESLLLVHRFSGEKISLTCTWRSIILTRLALERPLAWPLRAAPCTATSSSTLARASSHTCRPFPVMAGRWRCTGTSVSS